MTQQGQSLDDFACLWDSGDKDFRIGIVGTGPGMLSFLDIAWGDMFHDFLPEMTILAAAEPDLEHPGRINLLRERGIPVLDHWPQMLQEHPDINLVVEFSGRRSIRQALRQQLPESVSLMDHTTVVFLCSLSNLAKASSYCQTSLTRQKALLEAIIDEVREDILLLDRNWRVVDANRSVLERAGITKEQALGRTCWEVQQGPAGSAFCSCEPDAACPYRTTMDEGRVSEALMTRVDEAGHLRYFRVYAYPIPDPSGRVGHVMVMRRDITERTRQERLQQQSEKLAVIGEMSTYLAHEIRNPLFAIGGFTHSLLKSTTMTDKDREKLNIIAEETHRLDSLLTSILNFARPTRAGQAHADVATVVRETVDLMSVGYKPQGISFETHVDPGLPHVMADPEILKQCLVNLIKNSVEAMESGGGISLGATQEHSQAQGQVRVWVRDTGKGMTGAELERAFSPFYTTKGSGYGLGLAMIKKLTEEAGGRVDIASHQGQGTEVSLYFPAELATTTDGAATAPASEETPKTTPEPDTSPTSAKA